MSTAPSHSDATSYARSGVSGLDHVLQGGFVTGRSYLIEGEAGAGKTTLALKFVLEGVRAGETALYVTLSETKEELHASARSHGWDLAPVEILELVASEEMLTSDAKYTMFHPSEVELSETSKRIVAEVERIKPGRVVLDALSEIRLLAQVPLRYRRELLALRQFLTVRRCTTLFLDEASSEHVSRSIVHGIVELEQLTPTYGGERRRLRVAKVRGTHYMSGYHDFVIRHEGVVVFPRLIAAAHQAKLVPHAISSGVPSLDALVGGGLPAGSTTLLLGPAGTGKSSVATQYVAAAVGRGQQAAIFTFDETAASYLTRSASQGIDLAGHIETGHASLQQLDPAEVSPGEFVRLVREAVEVRHAEVLVIDSLNGYINSMPDERFLVTHLHELLTYLNQQGVATFLIVGQSGTIGAYETPANTSYLTDNLLFFRLFEAAGEVRKAIAAIKKRGGGHERTIHELRMGPKGIEVGEPLKGFQGVLRGEPVFSDNQGALYEKT